MGGFLEGLKALAGGWSDVKQIDKTGFDFREKRAAEQAARDQLNQKYQQDNEDWATQAATEADLGGADEGAIASQLPAGVNKALTLARMKGLGLQSKSSLESTKLYNRQLLDAQKARDAQKRLDDQQAAAEELARIKEKIRANQPLSPREQAVITSNEGIAKDRNAAVVTAAATRGSGGGRGGGAPKWVNTDNGYGWMYGPTEDNPAGRFVAAGVEPPRTAVERTRISQAGHVIEQAQALLDSYDDPEASKVIGDWQGVLNEQRTKNPLATLISGQANPLYQGIRAAEASLSAFQPIMHGSRGGEGLMKHFEDNIRGNPAVGIPQRKAAVQALIEAAQRIESLGPNVDLSDLESKVYGIGGSGGGGLPSRPRVGAPTPPAGGGGNVPQVRNAADYAALPSGTSYIDPNGKRRRKP